MQAEHDSIMKELSDFEDVKEEGSDSEPRPPAVSLARFTVRDALLILVCLSAALLFLLLVVWILFLLA